VRIVEVQKCEDAGAHEQKRNEHENGERGAYSRTVRDGPGQAKHGLRSGRQLRKPLRGAPQTVGE